MIYSMTGYGRYEIEAHARKVTVEISAVNHRYLDLNIRMPRMLMHLEESVRKAIKAQVARGKLEIGIMCHSTAEEDLEVIVNETLAKAYIKGLRHLGQEVGLEDDLKLSHLLKAGELVTTQKQAGDQEIISETITQAVEGALENFLTMRRREGEVLKEDLLDKVTHLEALTLQIEERSPSVVTSYKEKLETRLNQLLGEGNPLDTSRLETEIAIFADRCAIDEELTRLKSHFKQLKEILLEGGTVGRKLDFLMQEMNRETNTIGSKANDYDITKIVVALKTEIEKIREQVQNLE